MSRVLRLSGCKEENEGFWVFYKPLGESWGRDKPGILQGSGSDLTNEMISGEKLLETGNPFGRSREADLDFCMSFPVPTRDHASPPKPP